MVTQPTVRVKGTYLHTKGLGNAPSKLWPIPVQQLEIYPHHPGRSAQLSLEKCGVFTYNTTLAGGLANRQRNAGDL